MDRERFSRRLSALALTALLLSVPARTGQHFSYPIAVFSYKLHPSEPLDHYAAGKLGIILPSYARSHLYTAYRWMEGAPMLPDEQSALVAYWREKLGIDRDMSWDRSTDWLELREGLDIPYPDATPRDTTVANLDTRDYIQFMPCSWHGYELAAQRLREHIGRFGAKSAEVREWVQAQDLVFDNCDSSPAIPAGAPAQIDPIIRRDRLYQIAAAWFNSARFDEAERAFRKINPDPSWPGGLWAPYMVGRSILWQARTEHDDFKYERLLRRAQTELENVLRDDRFASTHDAARSLLLRILTVTDMEAGARLMGLRLMSPLRADSRQEDLEQYFLLLDAAFGSYRFKPMVDDPMSLGRRDGLTDWIVTFKLETPAATEHSIDRWRQTGSIAWLVAALQKIGPDHAAFSDLLEGAARIDRQHGWESVQYYRAKKLAEAGDRNQARRALDELIPALADRPSILNRAHALRSELALSFEEALRYGIRSPASFGSMTSSGEDLEPWAWREWEEQVFGPQVRRPMVTPELATILNSSISLARFSEFAMASSFAPQPLRREMVLAAWIRAVLLEDWDAAQRLASECAREAPETAASMREFNAANIQSRALMAKLVLLRFPGIGVQVRSGIGRNAPLAHIQLDGLNWWWWKDSYSAGLGGRPEAGAADWITSAERERANREWDRIISLGEGHDWLYFGVLKECEKENPPAACGEALYRTGASFSAIGYWHDPAWLNLELGYLDSRVGKVLKRSFPGSIWARHFDTDVESLKRAWAGPDGGYRNVVSYPR